MLLTEKIFNKRDEAIDVLRCIALCGLVLVHVNTPSWVTQLRDFDVPMMVFLSGVSFSITYSSNDSYILYVWKRFIRLIIPTWIFLAVYNKLFYNAPLSYIISQFPLITGWYVWIMRVFFIIALFAPFVYKLCHKLSSRYYLLLLVALLFINEIVCPIFVDGHWGENNNRRVILMMNFPFLLVFSLGVMIRKISLRSQILFGLFSLISFLFIAFSYFIEEEHYIRTNHEKYPPQFYYLAYAFACIIALWVFREKIVQLASFLKLKNLMLFLGQHTMWIYFYHIIALNYVMNIPHFLVRFAVVLFTSLLIVYFQHRLIVLYSQRFKRTGRLVRTIFDG